MVKLGLRGRRDLTRPLLPAPPSTLRIPLIPVGIPRWTSASGHGAALRGEESQKGTLIRAGHYWTFRVISYITQYQNSLLTCGRVLLPEYSQAVCTWNGR